MKQSHIQLFLVLLADVYHSLVLMNVSPEQDALRRVLIGHGLLILVSGLIGGLFTAWYMIGGFEYMRGRLYEFSLPGTESGWLKTHTGPLSNAWMVILLAVAIPYLSLSDISAKRVCWIVATSAWANVGFYYFANLSPNRGQAFGTTRLGPANAYSWLALGPTYLTNVVLLYTLTSLGFKAILQPGGKASRRKAHGSQRWPIILGAALAFVVKMAATSVSLTLTGRRKKSSDRTKSTRLGAQAESFGR
jgi:hypothetical protein